MFAFLHPSTPRIHLVSSFTPRSLAPTICPRNTRRMATKTRDLTMLNKSTLCELSSRVEVPSYLGKDDVTVGILHFGISNFHRAHQCRYIHDLLESGAGREWGIVGTTPRDSSSGKHKHQVLNEQDFLYTIVEKTGEETLPIVVGSIRESITPADVDAILERLQDPNIRIVSLTVTEGGYLQGDDKCLDTDSDTVKEEVERFKNGQTPQTPFGLMIKAFCLRREKNIPPFTVMSCDNMLQNGTASRCTVISLAKLIDEKLADWIEENVAFPSSMVDRITPGSGKDEIEELKDKYNLVDKIPIFCEEFRQWIVEDKFTCGRPKLDTVGVEFVDDVGPFERMKIKILNGGHASIAYAAGLLGMKFSNNAMEDDDINKFFTKVETEDIVPIVGEVPGKNLDEYFQTIKDRFTNPDISDTIPRLCSDGSDRQPKFIIDSIKDNLEKDRVPEGLALVSALWCRYCYGENENGDEVQGDDPHWDFLNKTAKEAKDNPSEWLNKVKSYGKVAKSDGFVKSFEKWLNKLWQDGTRACLKEYVES